MTPSSPDPPTAAPEGVRDLLAAALASGGASAAVGPIVERLRTVEYSLEDLLDDVAAVQAGVNGDQRASAVLNHIVRDCLGTTAAVHEAAIETMAHGFCELDGRGRVVFANPALAAIMPGCVGRAFAHWFGRSAPDVRAALAHGSGNRVLQLDVRTGDGRRPVLVELGRVNDGNASFAIVTDLSAAEAAERRVLAASPTAILKLGARGRLRFVNAAAEELLGRPAASMLGRTVLALLPVRDRARVREEMARRSLGEPGDYELDHLRPGARRPNRLHVLALPDLGYAGGKPVGTLAMLRPLDDGIVARELVEIIGRATVPADLFGEVMAQVARLMPFAQAYLMAYSADATFVRVIGSFPDRPPADRGRWLAVPAPLRPLVDREDGTGGAPDQIWRAFDSAGKDAAAGPEALEGLGVRSFLYAPIREKSKLKAVLLLLGREPGLYRDGAEDRLRALGAMDAAAAALRLDRARERSFERKFLRELASLDGSREMAARVCERLVGFYGWQNVALFKVNEVEARFELVAQRAAPVDGIDLPSFHTQPLADGLLGLAFERGAPVRMGDVDDGSLEAGRYVAGSPDTRSEICAPVRLGDRIVWMLCVGDRRSRVFEGPDELALLRTIKLLEPCLARAIEAELGNQALDMVPDGVVLVDPDGVVMRCNAKARMMLGGGAVGRPFAERLDDPEVARELAHAASAPRDVVVRDGDGAPLVVRMRHQTHESAYHHRVIVLEDRGAKRADASFARVDKVLADMADRARGPLSLVHSFLGEIARSADTREPEALAGLAEKALKHLDRFSFDHRDVSDALSRRADAAGGSAPDAAALLATLLDELPPSVRTRIRVEPSSSDGPLPVDARPGETAELIRNMLLRAVELTPGHVSTELAADRRNGEVELILACPGAGDVPADRDPADRLLAREARALGAQFERLAEPGGQRLRLSLPEAGHV
ncbi:PAS domain-containing protein [Sphingomonas sp. IW22]|uniref:PAS domain-containing protein n=1 Tax=Sphingomonas sp. IW22 TaxID=3242489 RepID=UPI003521E22C